MSNILKIVIVPRQLPPDFDPAVWFAVDGHIFFINGQDIWFPYTVERNGMDKAQLETLANAYFVAKAEEMYPSPPEQSLDASGEGEA